MKIISVLLLVSGALLAQTTPSYEPCGASITTTTFTLLPGAAASSPCNYTFDTTVRTLTAPVSVTSPSATDTWYVGILPSGGLAVGANTATATCASCSGGVTATGVTSFAGLGAFVRPLYTATTTSTAWNTSSLTDYRARQGTVPISQGTGITVTDSGAAVTVALGSVATSAIATPQGNGTKVQLSTGTTTTNDCVKFDANGNTVDNGSACGGGSSGTAPLADFADHASTSSTSSQGLGSGLTIASGAISSTGKLTEIKGAYTLSSFNTHGSLYALNVGGVKIQILNNAGSLTGTTMSFDCELQTTGANTVRASCVSGLGQNTAYPYVDVTDNTITLSGTALVQFTVTTDGTVGTITQKSFEVIARNY